MLWLWLILAIFFIFVVVAKIISEGLRETLVELVFLLSFFGLVNGAVFEPIYPLLLKHVMTAPTKATKPPTPYAVR